MDECILCAAVKLLDGAVPDIQPSVLMDGPDAEYVPGSIPNTRGTYALGRRHGDALHNLYARKGFPAEFGCEVDQGFLTNKGRYLNRADALAFARAHGADIPKDKGILCSEDLW